MTEDQAKTKWCPFARVAYTDACGNGSVNRVTSDEGRASPTMATQCFGSDCMAWRKRPVYDFATEKTSHDGYCGLAGRPE